VVKTAPIDERMSNRSLHTEQVFGILLAIAPMLKAGIVGHVMVGHSGGFGMTLSVALMVIVLGPAAEPLTLSGPLLTRGDELVYTGEVTETGDRIDNRYKKRYDMEVRLFVLESSANYADCAVQTTVQPLDDKLVSGLNMPGGKRQKASPFVRLDLIRVDDRGQVKSLMPTVSTPPLQLDQKTATQPAPTFPLDAPPLCELGAFIPLPIGLPKFGESWDSAQPNRPPTVWTAGGEAVWNGRRCVELTAVQQTDGYDLPDTSRTGWKRTETLLVSPTDGYASVLNRTIVRREGREQVGTVTAQFELQPANKYAGVRYRTARAEIETAWSFTAKSEAAQPGDLQAHQISMNRYLSDSSTATVYRASIEALKRRTESGSAPAVVSKKLVLTLVEEVGLQVGKPAPDFTAADVEKPTGRIRLSAGRGKPSVVIFYKPGSATATETLSVCEALFRKYSDTIKVIPLAVGKPATEAAAERTKWKITAPIYAGDDVRDLYGVNSYPRFYVVDSRGVCCWLFDAGIGPEVGYLVSKELDRLQK
jgi:hypothetical protein